LKGEFAVQCRAREKEQQILLRRSGNIRRKIRQIRPGRERVRKNLIAPKSKLKNLRGTKTPTKLANETLRQRARVSKKKKPPSEPSGGWEEKIHFNTFKIRVARGKLEKPGGG